MSFTNVALYAGLLVLMVYRRAQGRPVAGVKQLFVMPVIVTVLGAEDLSHARLGTVDIAVGVAGCAISLLFGALRGAKDKLSRRNGQPWVQWGAASMAIFAINVAAKLVLDVAGVAIGGSASGVAASLVLAVGLMLVGEAAVVWLRLEAGALPVDGAATEATSAPTVPLAPPPWSSSPPAGSGPDGAVLGRTAYPVGRRRSGGYGRRAAQARTMGGRRR